MIEIVQGSRRHKVTALYLRESARGEWRAEVRLLRDAMSAPLAGEAATLTDGATSWIGTLGPDVLADGGGYQAELLAGGGALAVATVATYYAGSIDAGSVLADLCAAAGEAAPESDATILPSWRTHGRALRLELEALARIVSGQQWRTLPSGALTFTAPDWTDATAPGVQLDAGHGCARYSAKLLAPLAGRAVAARRIGVAEYTLTEGRLTAVLWSDLGDPAAQIGKVREGKTTGQNGSRVDVDMLDGTRLGGVPLWLGVPGIAVVVPTGTRILVVDIGDDPRQTVAMLSPGESIDASDLGTALRIGDVLHLPVGSAGTPAPVPLVFAPGVGIDVGAPGSGKSSVML